MKIVETQVHPEMNGTNGFTVEFVGDTGETVTVALPADENGDVNRSNAVERAQAVMLNMANQHISDDADSIADSTASPAVQSLQSERRKSTGGDSDLEKGLEESFPASDPVSATSRTTSTGRVDAA